MLLKIDLAHESKNQEQVEYYTQKLSQLERECSAQIEKHNQRSAGMAIVNQRNRMKNLVFSSDKAQAKDFDLNNSTEASLQVNSDEENISNGPDKSVNPFRRTYSRPNLIFKKRSSDFTEEQYDAGENNSEEIYGQHNNSSINGATNSIDHDMLKTPASKKNKFNIDTNSSNSTTTTTTKNMPPSTSSLHDFDMNIDLIDI